MNRLKLYILIFSLALAIPLGYFVVRTSLGLAQEEEAELRYFAEALFERMEEELALFSEREESRAIDEYNYLARSVSGVSPLAMRPAEPYVVGYFQNNPDGTMQTPLAPSGVPVHPAKAESMARLEAVNAEFNTKRGTATESPDFASLPLEPEPPPLAEYEPPIFAERYLDFTDRSAKRSKLGQDRKRVREVPHQELMNVAPHLEFGFEQLRLHETPEGGMTYEYDSARQRIVQEEDLPPEPADTTTETQGTEGVEVEMDPMQSMALGDGLVYVFRRIMVNNQVFRQGVVIDVQKFMEHLVLSYFSGQPMSRFANLRISAMDTSLDYPREVARVAAGAASDSPAFVLQRSFDRPFNFLRATLACDEIPRSAGRATLRWMTIAVAAIMLVGMASIYQSARVVVDTSERRSNFVSSVTHELKTPLTNIRMYIEMLEQGMARSPEREQEYYRILGEETTRLSRLITNVLEFSRLESRRRKLDLAQGDFTDVLGRVSELMAEKLRSEGFELVIEEPESPPTFAYDPEVMVGVVLNLMENSVKFGAEAEEKRITLSLSTVGSKVRVALSDAGPGIPSHALKKVFDDFYRVEDEMTRSTKGTGIGLALVKKFVASMGGNVRAENNKGPGCTIVMTFPSKG